MKKVGSISLAELNNRGYELTEEQQKNSEVLLYRINIIRAIRNIPMVVSSGVRSEADQIRIYEQKGYAREKIPMGSKHLKGAAIDISDPDERLMNWCIENEHILERIGLWIERGTVGWVHFQSIPYGSYKPGKSMFFNA
jgi:hypothetical protein